MSAVADDTLLGTWYLREAYAVDPRGERLFDVYGARPSGVIHYGADGRMTALITHDGRARLSGSDRQDATDAESASAYRSSIGYAGRYVREGDWIVHHVDISSYPNWVGTRLCREVRLAGDTVELRTAPQPQAGVETVLKLVWQRVPVGLDAMPEPLRTPTPSATP